MPLNLAARSDATNVLQEVHAPTRLWWRLLCAQKARTLPVAKRLAMRVQLGTTATKLGSPWTISTLQKSALQVFTASKVGLLHQISQQINALSEASASLETSAPPRSFAPREPSTRLPDVPHFPTASPVCPGGIVERQVSRAWMGHAQKVTTARLEPPETAQALSIPKTTWTETTSPVLVTWMMRPPRWSMYA